MASTLAENDFTVKGDHANGLCSSEKAITVVRGGTRDRPYVSPLDTPWSPLYVSVKWISDVLRRTAGVAVFRVPRRLFRAR
ncbi:hypothetical protein JBE04_03480 [Streptomyces sp. PRKS01-29]|nr:hypothetical protein [Streptomyces sabulosicollis]MBI0293577.1 hypothetical protein [Streptomyces sabulosicollis]